MVVEQDLQLQDQLKKIQKQTNKMERTLPLSLTPGTVATITELNLFLESGFYLLSIIVLSLTTYRYIKNMKWFKSLRKRFRNGKKK